MSALIFFTLNVLLHLFIYFNLIYFHCDNCHYALMFYLVYLTCRKMDLYNGNGVPHVTNYGQVAFEADVA